MANDEQQQNTLQIKSKNKALQLVEQNDAK